MQPTLQQLLKKISHGLIRCTKYATVLWTLYVVPWYISCLCIEWGMEVRLSFRRQRWLVLLQLLKMYEWQTGRRDKKVFCWMRRESRSWLPEFLYVYFLPTYAMVTKLRTQQAWKNSKTYKIIIGKQQVKRALVRPIHRRKTSNKPFRWLNYLRRRAETVLWTRQWTGCLHKSTDCFLCFFLAP